MEKTARSLVDRLRAAGHIAYFAGGCVRDLVRGQAPKDIDIATDARPAEVQKIFPRNLRGRRTFLASSSSWRTVCNSRSRPSGRRRLPRWPAPGGSPLLFRRKKTRAAAIYDQRMFFDPPNDAVIDFVGGRQDLQRRLVGDGDRHNVLPKTGCASCAGSAFATVLDFEIEAATWEAIVRAAGTIGEISAERIRDELMRIFLSPHRARGWDLLDASGLMKQSCPSSRR